MPSSLCLARVFAIVPRKRLLIPLSAGGLIIGRKGANITALLKRSGAKVTLGQKNEAKANERVVTVQGNLVSATKVRWLGVHSSNVSSFVICDSCSRAGMPSFAAWATCTVHSTHPACRSVNNEAFLHVTLAKSTSHIAQCVVSACIVPGSLSKFPAQVVGKQTVSMHMTKALG